METITLKVLLHKGSEHIGIYFSENSLLNSRVKKIRGTKWSKSHACWYVLLNAENYSILCALLKNAARIDNSLLKQHLQKSKQVKMIIETGRQKPLQRSASKSPAYQLNESNLAALQEFVRHLQLHAYSSSTIDTYRNEFMQLLQLLKEKDVNSLTPEHLKRYMHYAVNKQRISENTAHSRLNALKYYFEQVLKREKFFWDIPRPKKHQVLPKVFSQDDIAAIINSLSNKKHKVMLMLAYSGGLRISEVVSLKTYQVDSRRMTIFINRAKGKKDRIITLSPVLLVMLREYAAAYKPSKSGYLFEGSVKDSSYSVRSLQEVIQAAKRKAGVLKPGGIHSLRHSFATHLIEKGTDVTMIQKLLGHNDIRTTMIYLHTSNKDLVKIVSPLDDLKLT